MSCTRELVSDIIHDTGFIDWLCEHENAFRFTVYQGMEAMEEDIDALELSVRSYNCLRRAGYRTINSLVDDIDCFEDFGNIRFCGRKNAKEIMLKLFLYTYENLKPEKRTAYLTSILDMN